MPDERAEPFGVFVMLAAVFGDREDTADKRHAAVLLADWQCADK